MTIVKTSHCGDIVTYSWLITLAYYPGVHVAGCAACVLLISEAFFPIPLFIPIWGTCRVWSSEYCPILNLLYIYCFI